MRRTIAVAMSILLTLVIMAQSMSIATFAIEDGSERIADGTTDAVAPTNDIADMPDIVCEIEGKRNEYKKEFLLEDGSYCSVIFQDSIHYNSNGKWIDIYSYPLSKCVENNVISINEQISQNTNTEARQDINRLNNSPFIVNLGTASGSIDTGITVTSKGFCIKPVSVGDYLPYNKLITFAGLSANCSLLSGTQSQFRVYEENCYWDETNRPSDFPGNLSGRKLMSLKTITSQITNYTWNITDLYSRWDRGDTNNDGIYVHKQSGGNVRFSNISIVVQYRNVDNNDLDHTYHTVDMGKAGNLYINDITNTFFIEQKLLSADICGSDFALSRIYSSTDPISSNTTGVGFKLNIESDIVKDNNSMVWNMPGGNTLIFVPSVPLITNGEYQLWEPLSTALEAELWTKTSELNNSVFNYSNLYVISNGVKYTFNNSGKLFKTYDSNNITLLELSYSNGLISEIINHDGYRFHRSIENSTETITLKNPNNQEVIFNNDTVDVSFSTDSQNYNTRIVTFFSGEEVRFTYDSSNRIVTVLSDNAKRIEIDYNDSNYGGYDSNYRLQEYSIYSTDGNSCVETMEINSDNTFQRFMYYDYPQLSADERYKDEEYDYDTNYKLITHKDTNDVYRCVEYDSNDIISSYVFSGTDNEFVDDNCFDDGAFSDYWTNDGNNIDTSYDAHSGEECIVMGFPNESSNYAYQIISDSLLSPIVFNEDETFVFGGWIKNVNTVPDEDRFVGIIVYAAPVDNGNTANIDDEDYVEISKIQYDNTANGTWQFKMKAFKLEQDSVLKIELAYINQFNFSYFDEISLYKAQETLTDIDGMITSSPIEYTYSNNKVASETLTWERLIESDLTMSTAYSYNQAEKLSSYEDFNGNQTYFQYDSNGRLSGKGHSVDNQNNITDVNLLTYDAENALLSTTQIIKNVETNSNVTLSTAYEEESETENGITVKCVRITHNGYDQVYKYDTDGMLLETYAESTSLPSDYTNYNTAYQYDSNKDIVQIDYSNGCRDVFYEIDEVDDYIFEDYICKVISCYKINGQTETLIKSYYYLFDESGELLISYDDSTEIRVDYSNNGYSLYDCSALGNPLIFTNETSNGSRVQTYSNTFHSLPESGTPPTYTSPDTIEIGSSSISVDNDGVKTSVSTVTVEKNQGNHIMTAEYERTSAEDYFGRLSSKEITFDHEITDTMSGSVSLTEEYEYKDLGNGRTSGLVSGYISTLSGSYEHPDENNSNTQTVSNFSDTYARHYEYDNRGNLIFVYAEENNNIVAKEYYEYDDANQVITEYNSENRIIAHYTYNAGGNLTAKIYYDFSSSAFDPLSRSITTLGNEIDRITYQYDSVWKDRLVNYDGVTITYDKMGNPLNYVGTNIEGASIVGTLEWHGNLLSAIEYSDAENHDYRIEYQYDRNGFRTSKALYRKRVENNNIIYSNVYVLDYLWDNGVLIGIIFSGLNDSTGAREELLNVNFIYDEEGSVSGYVNYIGIPYLFKKDIHDNILSLVFPDGEEMFTYSYDSWGNATATYSSYWSSDPVRLIIVKAIAMICPMAYHGYLYDYETGMCFNKGRCYSPDWGRNINPEDYEKLVERPENPLEANLYLFCNNNPLNILDKTASWHREYTGVEWKANGFEVAMSDMFASRPLCTMFASQVIKQHGTWDATKGYNYIGLNAEDIACDLFAHYVGKYAKAAINKVNAVWGDGWILNNSKSDIIFVYKDDPNLNNPNNPNGIGKYYKIWVAAPEIKAYAQREGIFITL